MSLPPSTAPDLAAHWCDDVRFVRALARHLVVDVNLADDIAQDAVLRALGGRAPVGGFRGWVTSVVRNLVTSHHRREGRRSRHERNAAPPPPMANEPPAVLAGLEAHALLLDAVRALDEPYRAAIVQRYFEGLSPRAIAARTGVPVRTVHTHLQRAMTQLRGRLRDRDPRWAALLLPLFPGHAAAAAVLAMTTTKTVLLGASAAAFALFLWWPAATPAPPIPPSAATSTGGGGTVAAATAMDEREVVAVAPAVAATPAPVPPPPEPWTLRGLALDVDGAPIPHVAVVLRDWGLLVQANAVTDARGAFVMTLPDVRGGDVDIDDPAWTGVLRPVLWGNRDVGELTIVAARAAPVDGIVVDEQGAPIAEVDVAIAGQAPPRSTFARNLERARDVDWRAKTGADGRFVVPRAPLLPGMRISASHVGYRPTHEDLTARAAVRVVLMRGEVLTGRVVDEHGNPVAATVFCHPAGANCGADGRFEIDIGNASSPWLIAARVGHLPARLRCPVRPFNVAASWPQPIELRLGGEALTIRGRAFAGDGTPLDSPQVKLLDAECLVDGNEMSSIEFLARVNAHVTEDGGAEFWESAGWPSPGAGVFELRGLQDRTYRLELMDPGTLQWMTSAPIHAGQKDVELRLPAEPRWPAVAGVVVDRHGTPIVGADVWIQRPGDKAGEVHYSAHLHTGADGRFSRGALVQSAHALCVQTPGTAKAKEFDLRACADVGALRIVAAVGTSVRVQTTSGADSVQFLDREGHLVTMTVTQGNVAWGAEGVALTNGASETVTVPDDAVTMVLQKDGREVARTAVDLRQGGLQVLQL
ncbi:MAG: sigma-70 family RNA polymerase sigma factor [Planctomycetes bacterium]|nr:sigma-70 family RNA polymerase sigma factor [Planctomycetota bacterium]